MALTQLADAIEPDVFEPYMQLRSTELSALFASGIVSADPRLNALLNGGGLTFQMPTWSAIAQTESKVGTDTTSAITPDKTSAVKDQAVRHIRNMAWSAADLVAIVVGSEPMVSIADQVAGYWAREWQRMLVASTKGFVADNVANDSGDMVYDIGTDANSAITAAEKVSADALLQAMQTLGDASGLIRALAMHSVVATELKRQNLIDFIPNALADVTLARYMDKIVIIDDGLPAVAGTYRIKYSTYLFGGGLYSFGRGSVQRPVEVDREPLQGNGSGVETLVSRQVLALHPRGLSFTNSSVASNSPTNTELATAANWNRVFPRKNIAFAELKTNG